MKVNAAFLKLVDPIGQSLLFILFAYSLDKTISSATVFLVLAAWQVASALAHLFVKTVRLLKKERMLYLLTITIYLLAYLYVTYHIKETFISVRDAHGLSFFPAHSIILITIGLIIAFWYYIVCFREIKRFYKRTHR